MNEDTAGAERARIELSAHSVLADEEIGIRLAGFPAQTQVKVSAMMTDDLGRLWSSEATFTADEEGCADLATRTPELGTYRTADAMGLIWSMALDPEEKDLSLFAKTDLEPTTIQLAAALSGHPKATATLEQIHIAEGVERIPVRENGLRGMYFAPPGDGPYPAVVVIGGSGGGLQEGQAALFASHGIAALALAYFAFEDLPAVLVDIPLEYFKTAVDWVSDRQEVDAEKIAFLGKSRGGEVALQLGSMFPEIRAVISYVPSHVIWSGIGDQERGASFAWTYQGEGIPYMPNRMTQEQAIEIFSKPRIPLTPMFLINLEDEAAVERTAIPVERINGPVLLISGKDDQMWPSALMSDAVMARLSAKGHDYADRHLSYEDAGHMILTPYRATTRTYSRHPVTGQVYAFGGTPEGYAAACKDSWAQVLEFLASVFG